MGGRSPFVLAAFVASVLAGCLGGGVPDDGGGLDDRVLEAFYPPVTSERLPLPDHDWEADYDPEHTGQSNGHASVANHAFGWGLDLVGYNPLTRPDAGPMLVNQDSSYIAMDTWGTYACIAHFVSAGTGGAEILDITDPANPRLVGSAPSGMVNSDCQFTDDGDFLLVASYTGSHDGLPLVPPPVGDAGANGVNVYDVSDKANPRFLFHDAQGAGTNGYHNVFTAQIHGTHYVFQTYTGHILALEPGATSLRMVTTLEQADHDMWVGHHPLTGEWIMITGAAGGTRIYGLEDPANPVSLGIWEARDDYTGWHRQWPLLNSVEGRALMVVAGEEGYSPESPTWYTVLDFTDPENLTEMGHWTIPNGGDTQHEFEVWDGYVATGNYHAGIWLFDVGTLERAMNPVTLGFYLPHEDPLAHGGTVNRPGTGTPNVWGAYFDERGYIYAAESTTGVYVLKFGATPE